MCEIIRRLRGGGVLWGVRSCCMVLAALAADPGHGAIAIADIASMPEYRDVQISPHGDYVAAIRHHESEDYLLILDAKSMSLRYSGSLGDGAVSNLWWVNDNRVALQAGYGLPAAGVGESELIAMNADGSKRKRLMRNLHEDLKLLSRMDRDKKSILVARQPPPFSGQIPVAYELDVYSGDVREVARAHPDGAFVTDLSGHVVFTTGVASDGEREVSYREAADAEFRPLSASISKSSTPLQPAGPGDFYTLLRNPGQNDRLVRWSPESGEAVVLLEQPRLVDAVLHADPSQTVYAVEYQNGGDRYAYLDGDHPMAIMHSAISKAFPSDHVRFTSATSELGLAVAHVSGDDNPGAYYLVDLKKSTLSELFDSYPSLPAESLSGSRFVEIPTRSFSRLPARLTIPRTQPSQAVPTVVLITDERLCAAFDWRAQLLASKGYATLKLGLPAAGSGDRAAAAASGWPGAVVDATDWLVEQGVAQKGHICTFGAGVGGSVAVSAALLQPRLHRCAVGYGGTYDAIDSVDGIDADVMLAYADGDGGAEKLRRALDRAGRPADPWLLDPTESNRVGLYHHVIEFLDARIFADHPPRVEDAGWDGGQEIICENVAEAGSRLKHRVCRTKQQIEAEKRRAQDELRRRQGMQRGGGQDG